MPIWRHETAVGYVTFCLFPAFFSFFVCSQQCFSFLEMESKIDKKHENNRFSKLNKHFVKIQRFYRICLQITLFVVKFYWIQRLNPIKISQFWLILIITFWAENGLKWENIYFSLLFLFFVPREQIFLLFPLDIFSFPEKIFRFLANVSSARSAAGATQAFTQNLVTDAQKKSAPKSKDHSKFLIRSL